MQIETTKAAILVESCKPLVVTEVTFPINYYMAKCWSKFITAVSAARR